MIRHFINMVPNTITLLNLLSGCIAIIFAFQPIESTAGLFGWQWAAIMMGAAAIFDFCDGAAARLLNAKSNIGKELDSLADLVSFGVAPALLLMNVLLLAGAGAFSYIALFLPLMGALRLAKFNVDTEQSVTFKGMPIPANAIFWIGFVAAMAQEKLHPTLGITIALIVAMGLLMVCNLPMFSLKMSSFSLRENFMRYFIVLATIIFIATLGIAGLAATILLYIAISALQRIVKITTA